MNAYINCLTQLPHLAYRAAEEAVVRAFFKKPTT